MTICGENRTIKPKVDPGLRQKKTDGEALSFLTAPPCTPRLVGAIQGTQPHPGLWGWVPGAAGWYLGPVLPESVCPCALMASRPPPPRVPGLQPPEEGGALCSGRRWAFPPSSGCPVVSPPALVARPPGGSGPGQGPRSGVRSFCHREPADPPSIVSLTPAKRNSGLSVHRAWAFLKVQLQTPLLPGRPLASSQLKGAPASQDTPPPISPPPTPACCLLAAAPGGHTCAPVPTVLACSWKKGMMLRSTC